MATTRVPRQEERVPPGKDRDAGWHCRAFRLLNEHLKSLVRPQPLVPLRFPRLFWREPMGLKECPYSHRWVLDFGSFALRLHHWHGSDDARAHHDHPYWFVTLCLWGGYTDVSPAGRDCLGPGSIRFRPAEHKHTVEVDPGGAVTFLVTGPSVRRWGFWVNGKLVKRDKYFAEHGHHPCEDGQQPVRIRPDRSRI